MLKNKIFIILIFISTCCFSQNIRKYCNGDLLFVSNDYSDFEKAIHNSTKNISETSFSHVAIIKIENDSIFVLEASPENGVIKTSLSKFLKKSNYIIVARLKEKYQYVINNSITNIEKHIGKEYDFIFNANNDKYYCSELIQHNFLDSLNNPIFESINMTFKNKNNGKIDDYWVKYFEKLKNKIPEGEKGTNPNLLYNSEKIDVIFIEK